jgi:hypothetical protein
MLNRIPNAIFVALFLCLTAGFVFVVGVSSRRPQPAPHQSPSQSSAPKNERQADSNTIEERHQATEEAIAYYTKWLMFFTAVLGVATWGWEAPRSVNLGSLETNLFLRTGPEFVSSASG